jgi:hypothetical protein
MRHRTRALAILLAVAAFIPLSAAPTRAAGLSPDQLRRAGWTCIHPVLFPTQMLCFSPGVGLPPLPGTPGFADRLPSYQDLVFDVATGAFLGMQQALRPDIYERGTPPCPQQPGGQYSYNPRNDLWICSRLGVDGT